MVKQYLIKTIIDNDKTYKFTKNKRNTYLEQLVLVMQSRQSGLMGAIGNSQWIYEYERNYNPMTHEKVSSCNFEFQSAFHLHGTRAFDIDTFNQIVIIAQKPKGMGDVHSIT